MVRHSHTETNKIDLSGFDNVFCDSQQALDWAYQNGLPESATIRSSAPALLWDNKPSVLHVEKRWSIEELGKFQGSIQKLTEDIFDASISVDRIERECALAVSSAALMFQRVLFKAACLEVEDFSNKRLVIVVDGKTGQAGNHMNSPWDRLLSDNHNLSVIRYSLQNDDWKVLTTDGVTSWQRLKLAGLETLIYRLATRISKKLPDWMFRHEVLIPSENELVIETATALALRGVKITEISPAPARGNHTNSLDIQPLMATVLPIIRERVQTWVVEPGIEKVLSFFQEYLIGQLREFDQWVARWGQSLSAARIKSRVVLTNSPGNLKGQALAKVCRDVGIPLVAAQHGVTVELSKLHGEVSVGFDNTVSDAVLLYDQKVAEAEERSYFARAESFVVGASSRHIRMKNGRSSLSDVPPIVYVSTNLYRGNIGLFISSKTDYLRARDEQKIVNNVLAGLPHKVCYKTYPEDNRRFADADPVLADVYTASNIELFSEKIDMRYLLSGHRVIVTSSATSTLGWPVMTGKPVVFINWKHNSPLADDARDSLSEGLFLFDDDEVDFYERLHDFLVQPIEEIEQLWALKKKARETMTAEFFSAYSSRAGTRAAKMILRNYVE